MSHHASELTNDFLKEAIKKAFGATGSFPRGKICSADEGQLAFGIAADHSTKTVICNFGKPIAWLGMTADEALEVSSTLRDKALEIKTGSSY